MGLAGTFLLFMLLTAAPPPFASGVAAAADADASPRAPPDDPVASSWSAKLQAEFKRVRARLPTLEYAAAQALLREARARVGRRPATLQYPQEKIEHMVVLFVENRAFDHIFGALLSDCDSVHQRVLVGWSWCP